MAEHASIVPQVGGAMTIGALTNLGGCRVVVGVVEQPSLIAGAVAGLECVLLLLSGLRDIEHPETGADGGVHDIRQHAVFVRVTTEGLQRRRRRRLSPDSVPEDDTSAPAHRERRAASAVASSVPHTCRAPTESTASTGRGETSAPAPSMRSTRFELPRATADCRAWARARASVSTPVPRAVGETSSVVRSSSAHPQPTSSTCPPSAPANAASR